MDSTHIGALLRRFRLAAALSQEALAERSTVSVRTISDLERGVRDTARLETLRLLAAALDLTGDDRALLIAAALPSGAELPDQTPVEPAGTPLPTPPNQLIGRDRMVEEIVHRVLTGNERLLTLIGPGGVGKTRLAVAAAAKIAEATGQPGVFLSLAPVSDPAVVPEALAQALGLSPGSASAESAVAWLRNRQRLLLFDNVEHLLDAAPFMSEILETCPGVSILATSRARLRLPAERELAVPPLDLPLAGATDDQISSAGAVRLFLERATAIDESLMAAGDTVSVAAEICRRVDGLPLAIELAASKLRVMPPAVLLSLLEKQLPVLTGGVRDQPLRQQSMRNTIAWSYDLLDQPQASLYRWMAVFVGGISLEAVAWTGEALGFAEAETFEALEGLLDSGLVQRMPGRERASRYRMLETIREFGLEQLQAAGELDIARLSHARFIASFAAEGAPLPATTVLPDWPFRLRDENANLIAAFDYVCGSGPIELCVEYMSIAGAYWDYWGPYEPGAARLLKALERIPMEPTPETARALYWTAVITMYAGEISRANQVGQFALEMSRRLGDRRSEAAALFILGWNAEISEHWSEASAFFHQALEHWIALGEIGLQGQIFMLLGGHAYTQGDYAEARRLEEAAQTILADAGNEWVAGPEWYLGFLDVAEGKLIDAARHFQRSLELWLDSASRTHHFKPIIHLADVAAELGAYETAASLVGSCDFLLESTGSTLFPFDVPAWERATERSRTALGNEQFETLHQAARDLGPADWLRLATTVVDKTESNQLLR